MELKKFNIVFARSAQRDLERFETETALQVVKDIKSYLETFPLGFQENPDKKINRLCSASLPPSKR